MKGQLRRKRTEMGHSASNWNTTLFFCLYSEMPRKSNIPSLIGIKLLVGVGVLCELFKVSSTTHWRAINFNCWFKLLAIVMVKQPLVNSSCMISPNLEPNADSEIQEIFVCGIRNLEFWSLESVIQLKESGILLTVGIKVSSTSNPKSSAWMEFGSTLWNPESRTALDHLTRGKWSQWNSSCEVASWWIKKCYRYLYKNSYLFFFSFHVAPPKTATSAEIMYVTFFQSWQARSLL